MTAHNTSDLPVNPAADPQAEAAAGNSAPKQPAPMIQRLSAHRKRINLAIKELETERDEVIARRDELRRQTEAVERGFAHHLEDIEATLKLYESGLNSLAVSQD